MRFTYSEEIEDYREALRLHRSSKISRRVKFIALYRVIPVLAAAGLLLLNAFDVKAQLQTAGFALSFVIALLWVGIMLVLAPSENLRKARKRCTNSQSVTLHIDDECVLIEEPCIRETKMFWKGFTSFAANDKITLLYYSENCFVLIPTRAVPSDIKQELHATINRNVSKDRP